MGLEVRTGSICCKGSRIVPIAKSRSVVVTCTAGCTHKSKYYKTDHNQDLRTAEPELKLSEEANAEVVDCDDYSQKNRDIKSGVCSWGAM